MLIPRTKLGALAASTLLSVFSLISCKDESASPTAPGSATVMGTVINGDDPAGSALAGVSVRVLRTGQAVQTDAAGNFTITGVPAGDQQFQFSRGDIDARGTISVSGGATVAVTAAISKRKTVLISPRGPNSPAQTVTPCGKGETQIEGIVTGNSGGTLTIFQEGHGTFTVTVTAETTIRKGQTPVALADILLGWRVHVKALCDCSGNCTAVEIIVQNENVVQTPGTGTPTVAATNTPTGTATVGTPTATNTPTITPTNTGTNTPTNTGTNTPTSTGTNTPTNTGTNTPTNTGTNTPTSTSTPSTPTVTPSATPTLTPTT
jgi:hypothetical protein